MDQLDIGAGAALAKRHLEPRGIYGLFEADALEHRMRAEA